VKDMVIGADVVDVERVVGFARSAQRLVLDDEAARSVLDHAAVASRAAAQGAAYGRTTGVGANRDVAASDHDGDHGMRLIRSHATGAGIDLGPEVARAAMVIRAHQLSRPGSGIPLEPLGALVAAAADGRTAPVRTFGGIGTGDIVVLAELALALVGERPWHDGSRHAYLASFGSNAALSFMSSSAPTLAVAALAAHDLGQLVEPSIAVAALGAAAIRGNPQQWSEVAAGTRPSPGVEVAAHTMRRVLAGCTAGAARTQDPLSWRMIPFLAGPLIEVHGELTAEIDRAIDARAENPRFTDDGVVHHGAFQLTSLGLRLDVARLALTQWLSTSLARLVKLHDPAYTGQGRFLASGPAGSSGTMVLEYTAASALETMRTLADPSSRHTTTISIGTEDHASFATRSAMATRECVDAVRTVLACELIAAVRALRGAEQLALGPTVRHLLEVCGELGSPGADRPLIDEIDRAGQLLASGDLTP
jgi:histidine ammonia-lyase